MRTTDRLTLLALAVSTSLIFNSTNLHATTLTWVGTTQDLTAASNWAPAQVPTSSDDGVFSSTASTFFPQVTSGNTCNLHSLNFTANPSNYSFSVNGQNAGPQATFNIGNGTDGGIVYFDNRNTQFSITGGSLVHFLSGSTANAPFGSSTTTFNVVSTMGFSNILQFSSASASLSTINVSGMNALVLFDGSSSANTSTLNGTSNATILFTDTSTAGSSVINMTSLSQLNFAGSASLANSTVNLNAATFNYNSSMTTSTATLNMANGANGLLDAIELVSLTGDAASSLFLNSNLTINNTNSTVIASSIFGLGSSSLTKKGTGTITLSGNNNYGTTAIMQGTVIATESGLSSGNVTLLNGTLNLSIATSSFYTGNIESGAGQLLKTGIGEQFLSGNSAGFAGTTHLLGGTLGLSGAVLGGNVFVESGTTLLSDNGRITGNTTLNGGKVTTSGMVDILTINGNYVQKPAATYEVAFESDGKSSFIGVDGTADLSGTLLLTLFSGVVDQTQSYLILHADGGVKGRFNNVVVNGFPTYVPTITYFPNDVVLSVEFILASISETFNELQVARQIQSIDLETASPAVFDLYLALVPLANNPETINLARESLASLSGEQYTNTILAADMSGRQFIRRLYEPVRSLIVGGGICQNKDYYYNVYESNGYMCLDDACWTPSTTSKFNPWLQMGGGHTFLRHDSNAHGFQSNNYQLTFGGHTTAFEMWTIGLAGGYEYERLSYNLGGSCNNNLGFIGLYSVVRPSCFYFLTDLAYELGYGKVKRPVTVGNQKYQARSKPAFSQAMFYGELGTDIEFTSLMLQPFFGLEVNYFNGKRFNERNTPAENLSIHKKCCTNVLSRLGIHWGTLPWCDFTFNLDLAWLYRFTSTSNRTRQNFQEFGNTFTIKGVSFPRNGLDVAASISYALCDRWELTAVIDAERWSRSSLYNIYAGISYAW